MVDSVAGGPLRARVAEPRETATRVSSWNSLDLGGSLLAGLGKQAFPVFEHVREDELPAIVSETKCPLKTGQKGWLFGSCMRFETGVVRFC